MLLDDALAEEGAEEEVTCPITRTVFRDPVRASDGFVYERAAIVGWFEQRLSSPLTGLALNSRQLVPASDVAARVAAFLSAHPERAEEAAAAAEALQRTLAACGHTAIQQPYPQGTMHPAVDAVAAIERRVQALLGTCIDFAYLYTRLLHSCCVFSGCLLLAFLFVSLD